MFKPILNNWSLKLTALIAAILLWSHVRGQVNPWEIAPFKVPLEVHAPRNMILTDDTRLPKTVIVTLRGPRLTLRALKGPAPVNPLAPADTPTPLANGQVRAELDFSDAHPGTQSLPVKASADSYDLDVVGTNPGEVQVNIQAARKNSH